MYSEIWLDPRLAFKHLNICATNITLKSDFRTKIWNPGIFRFTKYVFCLDFYNALFFLLQTHALSIPKNPQFIAARQKTALLLFMKTD